MTACLSDYTLWSISEGDAAPDERAHLAECTLCAWRARHMASDLGLIVQVLEGEPPPREAPVARSFPVRTFAIAAMVFLAVGLSFLPRWRTAVSVDPSQDGVAELGRLSSNVFDVDAEDDDGAVVDDADPLEDALLASAPCEWQPAGCRDIAQPLF